MSCISTIFAFTYLNSYMDVFWQILIASVSHNRTTHFRSTVRRTTSEGADQPGIYKFHDPSPTQSSHRDHQNSTALYYIISVRLLTMKI